MEITIFYFSLNLSILDYLSKLINKSNLIEYPSKRPLIALINELNLGLIDGSSLLCLIYLPEFFMNCKTLSFKCLESMNTQNNRVWKLLSKCPSLKTLIFRTVSIDFLSLFDKSSINFSSLKTLKIYDIRIDPFSLPALYSFPNLHSLTLYQVNMNEYEFLHLLKSTQKMNVIHSLYINKTCSFYNEKTIKHIVFYIGLILKSFRLDDNINTENFSINIKGIQKMSHLNEFIYSNKGSIYSNNGFGYFSKINNELIKRGFF